MNADYRLISKELASTLKTRLQVTPARCRECREVVRTLEDVCPHCGAQAPARLSPWISYAVLGVMAWMLLLLIF